MSPRTPAHGPLGRIRYATDYFRQMSPAERPARLRAWALKPNLPTRAWRFLVPSGSTRRLGQIVVGRRKKALECVLVRSWSEARMLSLDTARHALERAGLDYVELDDIRPSRTQLAVDLQDKERVVEAFARYADPRGELIAWPWTALRVRGSTGAVPALTRRRIDLCTGFVWNVPARIGTRGRVLDHHDYGTAISFWGSAPQDPDRVYGSLPNRWSSVVPHHDGSSTLAAVRAHMPTTPHIDDVDFPVDLVCLWVDGEDPAWQARRADRLRRDRGEAAIQHASDATMAHLYRDRDELRFALRSIVQFAPFINHVYLVTDRQVPEWLDTDAAGLTVVDHADIFPTGWLPVFNSNAIDTRLHHIPGLSEHFLVSNDDVLFSGPVVAGDFFTRSGQPRIFLSKAAIPLGGPTGSEPGVDSAAKANRELIKARHGVTITQKFKHIMLPQRITHRQLTCDSFPDEIALTGQHAFRQVGDVAFSHLALYDAYFRGDAVIGDLAYDYISLGDPRLDDRLSRIELDPGRLRVLCVNDGDTSVVTDVDGRPVGVIEVDIAARERRVERFFSSLWPHPCPWEIDATIDSHPQKEPQ